MMGSRKKDIPTDFYDDVMKSITDDWVQHMTSPKTNLSGPFAQLALHSLPLGVDSNDPRVIEIIKKIRDIHGGE
jgi:hypothetical protein